MEKFVELIERVHKERFSVVIGKIITKKIPTAFLSLAPINDAVEIVNQIRSQGVNVTTLITVDSTPPLADLKIDYNIVHINKAMSMYNIPEYIFVIDDTAARVAIKNFPRCKTISINRDDTEYIYTTFMNHLKDLKHVYESLIDEESKKAFCGYWLGKISNKFGECYHTNSSHYLPAGFIPKNGAITFDAGVFDGGTATVFSEMGYKVYGFEMDRKNYEKVKPLADEKHFVVENLSLGSYKHEMRYNSAGHSGSKWNASGADITQVTTIDVYARENHLPSVDFIKLDVEGAELDILKGARISIARFKPILAISAYHKLDDFWTLMNYIKSIRPDYEFALRHGAESPEEEPQNFTQNRSDYLYSLGLEVEGRNFSECVLFAR